MIRYQRAQLTVSLKAQMKTSVEILPEAAVQVLLEMEHAGYQNLGVLGYRNGQLNCVWCVP